MPRGTPQIQYAIPTPEGWQRNLIIALFLAYVVELILANLDVPLYVLLAWSNWIGGEGAFEAWQPATRFLIQGRSAVVSVLISLVVLYFFLPAMDAVVDRRALGRAVAAGAIGGTILPLVLDVWGILEAQPLMGWQNLVLVLPVLFGIARPDQDILLVVFPIKAKWFLWGSLVLALLLILAEQTLGSFELLGVWLGVAGWWHGLGPGRRRRELRQRASGIERELSRFQVLDGGREGPQGSQDNGDDWIH